MILQIKKNRIGFDTIFFCPYIEYPREINTRLITKKPILLRYEKKSTLSN